MDLLNKMLKNKSIFLILSLALYSFVYSVYTQAYWGVAITLILSIFGIQYFKKKDFKFDKTKYPIFAFIIAVPMFLTDIILFIRTVVLLQQWILIPIFVLALYAGFFISFLIGTWLSNIVGDFIKTFSKYEVIFFIIGWIILTTITVIAHLSSCVFSADLTNAWDIIFTSDTGLLKGAFYLPYQAENDIRQFLFGLFARPVYGIAFPISILTTLNVYCVMNILQNALLMLSLMMVCRMCFDDKIQKGGLLALCIFVFSFSALLYTMPTEQYIIATFYLIIFLYHSLYKEENDFYGLGYTASTGTLLTSAALICFPKGKTIKEKILFIIRKFTSGVITLVSFMFIFGRGDIITSLGWKMSNLMEFSSVGGGTNNVTLLNKLQQYTVFVKSCFVMPETQIIENGLIKIQGVFVPLKHFHLSPTTSFDIIGIIILVISLIGLIWGLFNKKTEKISKISLVWFLISVFCMVIAGWGAVENGLTLYVLYFGWVFLVGVVLLIEKIKIVPIKYCVYFIIIGLLLYFNISGVSQIINFAHTYFPL